MRRKPNEKIRLKQAHTLSKAFDHAARLGLKPNYQLNIQWRLTAFVDTPREGYEQVNQNTRKWLGRRGLPHVWIYAREREGNRTSEHLHAAIYCPDEYAEGLQEAISCWAEAFDPRAVLVKPFDTKPWCNARTWTLGYLLKGGNKAVRDAYDVPSPKRVSPHRGTIEGKRVGTSRILGAKAIAEYFADGPLVLAPHRKSKTHVTASRPARKCA